MQLEQSGEPGVELVLTIYLRDMTGRLLPTEDGIGAFITFMNCKQQLPRILEKILHLICGFTHFTITPDTIWFGSVISF